MEMITSPTNSKLKLAISLAQKKYRDKHGLFILEGLRNAEMAQAAKASLEMCFCTEQICANPRAAALIAKLTCPVYTVSETLYAKLSDTQTPQGLMLLVKQHTAALDDLPLNTEDKSFFLVLDRLQDPGNIGTIIRTADAMGVDAVICMHGTADIYAPKVVRAAMGSLFNLPICTKVTETDLLAFAKKHSLKLYAAALNEQAKPLWQAEYQKSCAVILGNEANGVAKSLLNAADTQIYIPMQGRAESLNVASACAMIVYERCRQNI